MSYGSNRAHPPGRKSGRRLKLRGPASTNNVMPIGTHPHSPIRRFGSTYLHHRCYVRKSGPGAGLQPLRAAGAELILSRRGARLRDGLTVVLGSLGMLGFVASYAGVVLFRVDARAYLAASTASLALFVIALILARAAGLTPATKRLKRAL